jgi:transposase
MFSESFKLIIDNLKEGKHTKKIILLGIAFVISIFFLTQFFFKGSLNVSVKGMEGNTTVKVSKIIDNKKDESKAKEYSGRNISAKLSPGNYRVEVSVTDSKDSSKTAKTIKYTNVVARKTTTNSLTAYQSGATSIKDTIDKAGIVGVYKDKIDVTTVYGVTTTYNIEDIGEKDNQISEKQDNSYNKKVDTSKNKKKKHTASRLNLKGF